LGSTSTCTGVGGCLLLPPCTCSRQQTDLCSVKPPDAVMLVLCQLTHGSWLAHRVATASPDLLVGYGRAAMQQFYALSGFDSPGICPVAAMVYNGHGVTGFVHGCAGKVVMSLAAVHNFVFTTVYVCVCLWKCICLFCSPCRRSFSTDPAQPLVCQGLQQQQQQQQWWCWWWCEGL